MGYLSHLYQSVLQNPYDAVWAGVGVAGQVVFGIRMFIQWLKSEQAGHSVIPIAFWYCSLAGAILSMAYIVHQQAWPLLLGQGLPLPIYIRNIWMIYRDQRKPAQSV